MFHNPEESSRKTQVTRAKQIGLRKSTLQHLSVKQQLVQPRPATTVSYLISPPIHNFNHISYL